MNIEFPPPRHMRWPGDDGYCTPTFEDAENYIAVQSNDNSLCLSASTRARKTQFSALQALHGSSYRKPEGNGVTDVERVRLPQSESRHSDAVLSWRKRIRHFTWAFFTLTMATGGIANVLYTSTFTQSQGL
jgi:hypothetical protein